MEEKPQKKAYLITLGCPKNSVISQKVRRILKKSGYRLLDDSNGAELILVNTCGFIESAKEESINTILELVENNPQKPRFAVFGCLVQRYKEELTQAIPEIEILMDFDDLGDIDNILGLTHQATDDSKLYVTINRSWEYLQISDGCDRRCSFCAIPEIKGKYRSIELDEIVDEAGLLVKGGAKELVLVGQDTSLYGEDLGGNIDLAKLLDELMMIDDLGWIRIMYQQIESLSSTVVERMMNNRKMCNYLDLPFQHSSKKILRSMNRYGEGSMFIDTVDGIRKKIDDVAIRTSVIVGYPGESNSDYTELVTFIEKLKPDYLGVFEYSAEEGTRAALMPSQIDSVTKRERANGLREVADNIGSSKKMDLVGETKKAIIDNFIDGDRYLGRLEGQAPEIDGEVTITSVKILSPGDIVDVVIWGSEGYDVSARLSETSRDEIG